MHNLCTHTNGAAAQLGVAPETMRSVTRALGNAVRSQRHLAGMQQRMQASLARDVTQPELPSFDHEPVQYTGPSKQEVIELRKRYLNPGEPKLSVTGRLPCWHGEAQKHLCRAAILAWYKDPVMITEGKMQYLYDETGRRYLDVSLLMGKGLTLHN